MSGGSRRSAARAGSGRRRSPSSSRTTRIAWKTIDGEVKNDGVVTFEQVGDGQTRVNVQMDVESESTVENVAGGLLGIVKGQVHGDLERFKQLIENPAEETGAWRGQVKDGQTK